MTPTRDETDKGAPGQCFLFLQMSSFLDINYLCSRDHSGLKCTQGHTSIINYIMWYEKFPVSKRATKMKITEP